MCGIGAAYFTSKVDLSRLERLALNTETRGQDGFGISVLRPSGGVSSFRTPMKFSDFVLTDAWRKFSREIKPGDVVIWNNRAQPLTEVKSSMRNMQPVSSGRFIAVHNGVVSNAHLLTRDFDLKLRTNIDSEVITAMLEKYCDIFKEDTIGLIQHVFRKLSGGFAVVLLNKDKPKTLYLIKDFKTLWYGTDGENFFVASEEEFLKDILGEKNVFTLKDWDEVRPYTGIEVDLVSKMVNEFPIETKKISSLPDVDENRVLVCASGGIDSTTVAYIAKKLEGKEVILVHFNLGQKSEKRELEAIEKISKDLGAELLTIDIRWLGELGASPLTDLSIPVPKSELVNLKSTVCWTPSRNLVMLSILAAIAEAKGCKYIYSGFSLEEEGSYADNSVDFFKKFNELLYYGTISVPQLKLVLGRIMKSETVMLGKYLGVPYEHTWSCDDGKELQCGECGACWLHHNAFVQAGLEDPSKYLKDPEESAGYRRPYVGGTKKIDVEDVIARLSF